MQVKEIIRVKGKILFTTTPEQSLQSAVDAMADMDVGSLVVMDAGHMVGMLTFREVLRAFRQRGSDISEACVNDIMVRDVTVAVPDMELGDLRCLMVEKHVRYLPVLDGDVLMGVISFHDVARAVLEEQRFENRMLKNYIRNWPEEEDAPG